MVPVNYATDISDPIDICMEGKYHWQLLYYIDHRGQNDTYKERRKVTTTVRTSYPELIKSVVEASTKVRTSLDVGGVFEIITASVKGSIDATLYSLYQSMVEKKGESIVTKELTREFSVGPDSVGELYRLVYDGPGVSYETNIISSDGKRPYDKVFINCQVRQTPLLKDIRVVYTENNADMPIDSITDTLGGSADINKGFGGKYVWLVPVWSRSKDDAVSKIQVLLQGEQSDGCADLAKGAGGLFRYLKMLQDRSNNRGIYRVGLLRSQTNIFKDIQKYGWDECTDDINRDRKGDFLHLCWNTVP